MNDFPKESVAGECRPKSGLSRNFPKITTSLCLVAALVLAVLAKLQADDVTFTGPINYPIVNTNQNLTLLIYDVRAIYSTDPSYTAEQWFEETHYYGWRYDENNGITSELVVNGASLPYVDYVTFQFTHSYPIDYDGDGIPDDYGFEPLTLMPNETRNFPYFSEFTYPWGTPFYFVMFQVDAAWGGPPPCTNSTLSQTIQCGTLLSAGSLSATSIQVCPGGSVTPPTASGTDISDGLKQIVVSNCISGIISTSSFPITYSLGPVVFTPAMTGPFTTSQSYSAQLTATPSDTNCQPIVVPLGSVSVEVVNTEATNVTVNCGSLLTPGTLAASNLWVCLNGTVAPPGIATAPVFTNGMIITSITDCNTMITTSSTNEVTYTLGELYFDPVFPEQFANTGSFTFTVLADAEPSDPRCDPIPVSLGSFTVNVTSNSFTNVICAIEGSVANPGSLSASNLFICVGEGVAAPTLSGLTFSNGQVLKIVVDCSTGTTNITTNTVTYTHGPVRFQPSLPSSFDIASTWVFSAVVDAIPSDTNCSVFPVTVGYLTVTAGQSVTNINVQCGSVASSGSMYPTSVQVCTNGTLSMPSFTMPTFSSGQITTSIYDCPSGNTTVTTTPISYSPGGVYFDPPLPSSFPNAGSWSFAARVQAASSDSRCPPLTATLGTFTVNVVDTSSTNIVCAAAGSLLNAGTLSTNNAQVCAGSGAPNAPTGSGATFSDGILHTIVINCGNSGTNITVTPVGYTAGDIYLDPPLPSSFEETGTHVFTVKVDGMPSHPACPVVTATLGSFTVVVGNALTNETFSCGSVASSGSLLATALQVCLNGSVGGPNFVPPVFASGKVIKEITDCSTWETTMQTNPITYSPGGVYYDPPLPGSFTNLGTQSFTAMITATPSDSRCSPLTATLGTFTVEVVNTASTNIVCASGGSLTNATWGSSTNFQVCLNSTVTPPSLAGAEFSKGYIHKIVVDCATGTTNTTTNEVSYTVGQLTFEPPIPESFSDANTYTFTAMVEGIPSDTNCPPILASLGTVTITAGWSTTNLVVTCGSVTNENTIGTTNFMCVGGSFSPPSITGDFFLPGFIEEVVIDCENSMTNVTVVADVNYAPQTRFDPPLPTGPITIPGVYQFRVYVDGISSTNLCENLTASAGTITVVVSKVTIALGSTNVLVNIDDDNNNGTNDVDDALSGPASEVVGENDLVPLSLSMQGTVPLQTVTLTASGKVRIWDNNTRGTNAPVLDAVTGSGTVTWPVNEMPTSLWIEGVEPSASINDVLISVNPSTGCGVATNLTVYKLKLIADVNRDGQIGFGGEDASSQSKRFYYWANDDDDSGNTGGNDIPGLADEFSQSTEFGPDYHTANYGIDSGKGIIGGRRDLVDFFPVYLNIKETLAILPPSNSIKYKIKHGAGLLNFSYTSLMREQAQLIHHGLVNYFFTGDLVYENNVTRQIVEAGIELNSDFLTGMVNGSWGVLLVEARQATEQPLVLCVEKDGVVILETQLHLKISDVESMYRHVNLAESATDYFDNAVQPRKTPRLTQSSDPGAAYPDSLTNGKYFVFVHGFNVSAIKARGWHAELFKRLHVLGSRARFVGVTWNGDLMPDYHTAAFYALRTGDRLKASLWFTEGSEVNIAGHSLGNMVVGHAIQFGGLRPNKYFIINGAVQKEAYNFGEIGQAEIDQMTENLWKNRERRLFPCNWHELFDSTPADNRNKFTWKNRFSEIFNHTDVFNFYSPGEEVVANPANASRAVFWETFQNWDLQRYAWVNGELVKGYTGPPSVMFDRTQAGWQENPYYPATLPTEGITSPTLRTQPYFAQFLESDLTHVTPAVASEKAGQMNVIYDILCRAIPATSFAIAANPLALIGADNINMEADGRVAGVWPSEGHDSDLNIGRWLHSDFKNVALPFVVPMYQTIMQKGGLK